MNSHVNTFFFFTLFTLSSYLIFFWTEIAKLECFFFLSFQFWSSEMCVVLLGSSVSGRADFLLSLVFTWSAEASSCFLKTGERKKKINPWGVCREPDDSASPWVRVLEPRSQTHPGPSGTCWLHWAPARGWSPGSRPLAPRTDLKTQDSRLTAKTRSYDSLLCHWISLTRFLRASAHRDLLNLESYVGSNMIPNQLLPKCKKKNNIWLQFRFFPQIMFLTGWIHAGLFVGWKKCRCNCPTLLLPAAATSRSLNYRHRNHFTGTRHSLLFSLFRAISKACRYM